MAPGATGAHAAFPVGTNGLIAYHQYDGQFDVFTMSAPGAGRLNLTNDPGYQVAPSFSPNGRRIAFAQDTGGATDIFVLNSDGSNQVTSRTRPPIRRSALRSPRTGGRSSSTPRRSSPWSSCSG